MKREIGSHFWINEEDIGPQIRNLGMPEIFGCYGTDYVWVSTGRSAIALIIKTIEQRNPNISRRVCIPAFTCHTVFEPFLKAGYDVITIPISKDLNINRDTFEECVRKYEPGIVLLHNYFGFDTLGNIRDKISNIQSDGIIVIEDLTQCIYSSFPRIKADYWIGSIRKWNGMPDGAFAVCAVGQFLNKPEKYDKDLESSFMKASLLKRQYIEDGIGEKSVFLHEYKRAESILAAQSEICAISPTSSLIQANLIWNELSVKRRSNFQILLSKLGNITGIRSIFDKIDEMVVPLYFPIYCDQRDAVQRKLISQNIYAPIVWPKAQNLPEIDEYSEEIYNHILCLPIDQRYDEEDMNRIVQTIREKI